MKLIGLLISILTLSSTYAGVVEVKMYNKTDDGKKMVFVPSLIKANPGDTIKFVAMSAGHQVQSFRGGVPSECDITSKQGKKPEKKSKCSDKYAFKSKNIKKNDFYSVTLKKEGHYAIMCKPHFAMGMVGLIVVGNPKDKDNFKKALLSDKKPGKKLHKAKSKSRKRFNEIFAQYK